MLQWVPAPDPGPRAAHSERRAWIDSEVDIVSRMIPGTQALKAQATKIFVEVRCAALRFSAALPLSSRACSTSLQVRARLAEQLAKGKTIQLAVTEYESLAELLKQPTDNELRDLVARVRAVPLIAKLMAPDQKGKVGRRLAKQG